MFGPLHPDDWPATVQMWRQTFNIAEDHWGPFRARLGDDAFRVWRAGGRITAGLAVYRCGQYFGGRAVPMAGVALVGVPPEERGGGAGIALMAEMLREQHARGVGLSTLYPATRKPYRRVGYEVAGTWGMWKVDVDRIGLHDREAEAIAIDPSRPESLHAIYAEWARSRGGALERSQAFWERLVQPVGLKVYGSMVPGEGYVVWTQGTGERKALRLEIREFVANTPRAVRRLWTIIADHRSIADEVRWRGPGADPLVGALEEESANMYMNEQWMTRIVHLPAAMAARGWGADGTLDLDVADPVVPENAGRWRLVVEDGVAEVSRGGKGSLECDIRGLAPLYTGMYSPAELAGLGWITGDPHTLRTAGRLFVGPAPWMSDRF